MSTPKSNKNRKCKHVPGDYVDSRMAMNGLESWKCEKCGRRIFLRKGKWYTADEYEQYKRGNAQGK